MANSNNWGEIYKSTWWGDKAWSANTLFIDSAPPGFGLNLLKASEDMNITLDWSQTLISVAANSTDEAAPNGTDTAEKLTFTDNRQSRIQQQIDLEANTTYTFSVYAKVRTGTQSFRLRNVTLGQAQQFTADTSWGLNPDDGRYSFSFTTGATAITHTLSIQNAAAAGTGEVFFWGAMLNEGATAGDYVKTDASVGGSAPTPAYSGFGDAFGGAAAYYSLRKFTEAETLNAIRVRRSSDDTEQDIGFDSNGDLDTTALLAFVNTDVNQYTSDFSSTEDLGESNGTGAAAQSVGGVDDAYKFTLSGGSNSHNAFVQNQIVVGQRIQLTFDYYIPEGQVVDGLRVSTLSPAASKLDVNVTGSWQTATANYISDRNDIFFNALNGSNLTIDADGDVFYLKNIVVTQTTADGAVTTFYDQSGNGNDATNSTESEQPLVVSGGTLVEENSKAAIEFDGVDDSFGFTALALGDMFISSVQKIDALTSALYNGSSDYIRRRSSNYRSRIDLATQDFLGGTFGQQTLISFERSGSSLELYEDGASLGTATTSATFDIDEIGGGQVAFPFDGTLQEIVFFESDQSTNRTGIEGNINDHFDIYT